MSLAYTTEELIEEVRNQYQVGDSGSLGTEDPDILRYLNKEMMLELIPQVAKLHEEYFIVTELIPLTVTNTLSDTHVKIPDRAVGQSLRDVLLVKGSTSPVMRLSLPRIGREDLPAFEIARGDGSDMRGFFLENVRIRVFPSVVTGDELEVSYMFRPSQLVKSDGYRTVTALDTVLNTVTLSGSGSPFVVGDLVDIHGPNSGSEIKVWDNAITVVAGNVLTLTDPIDGTDSRDGRPPVDVGDFVVLRETSAIPMLPRELHTILAQAAVVRLAEAIDDESKYKMHLNHLNRELKLMQYYLEKRVTGRPRKIVNRLSPLWRQGNVQRRSL
jgi:hypothetical protein